MLFGLMDEKLLAFLCLKTFSNIIPSINPNDMKIPRLDAPCYDELNEPKFINF